MSFSPPLSWYEPDDEVFECPDCNAHREEDEEFCQDCKDRLEEEEDNDE